MGTSSVVWTKEAVNASYRFLWNCQKQVQIVFGGSSSGKSFFIFSQRTVKELLEGGRNFLVIRNVAKTNRHSTWNQVLKGVATLPPGIQKDFSVNQSEMVITGPTGHQAIFKGLDDIEKIKSVTPLKGPLTDIIIEEATECPKDKVKQLRKRMRGRSEKTKRLCLLFNPVYKTHWIYEEFFAGRWRDDSSRWSDERTEILKTTYKDNLNFLGEDEVYELENETDEYFKNVYTYGNWGVLGDTVFTNWETVDLSDRLDAFGSYRNGLDFGFASDPAALYRGALRGNEVFACYGRYHRGMDNEQLADAVLPVVGGDILVCDSAEPKSVQELNNYRLNAIGSKKGPDSLKMGIRWLQGKKIYVHYEEQDLINELTLYQWQKDKDGNSLPRPVDKHNHVLDAMRYAHERDMIIRRVRAGTLPY